MYKVFSEIMIGQNEILIFHELFLNKDISLDIDHKLFLEKDLKSPHRTFQVYNFNRN